MAKAKSQSSARGKAKAAAPKRAAKARVESQAMPRSMQKRGKADGRKAVQQPRAAAKSHVRGKTDDGMTRVTHETEVRGTETRVERVVERAPKPSLDRKSTRLNSSHIQKSRMPSSA